MTIAERASLALPCACACPALHSLLLAASSQLVCQRGACRSRPSLFLRESALALHPVALCGRLKSPLTSCAWSPGFCWRGARRRSRRMCRRLISSRARVAATWPYFKPSCLTGASPVRVGGCRRGWLGDWCGFCHFRGDAADAPRARTIATTRGIYSAFVSLDLSLRWARAGREGGSRGDRRRHSYRHSQSSHGY